MLPVNEGRVSKMKTLGYYTITVFLGLLATSRPAHAYLDPGAGSYAIQMVLAGLFGGFVAFRSAIFHLLSRIRSMKSHSVSRH